MKPSFNLELVNAATKDALERGDRILQTHWYADTDEGQASYLLATLEGNLKLPLNSVILDNGCGIGEICRILAKKRPDLNFVMTNISEYQLSFCPIGDQFLAICCDSHELKLPSDCVDAVMLSSTLCQLDAEVALDECYRVLVDGGLLLINDMVRNNNNTELEDNLAARVVNPEKLRDQIEFAGFTIDQFLIGTGNDHKFRALLKSVEHWLDGVQSIIVRAVK
jgi:ubiquinone/menaquinone biosynthesis C-methylase UbiE